MQSEQKKSSLKFVYKEVVVVKEISAIKRNKETRLWIVD
jgi:hypothetical protein